MIDVLTAANHAQRSADVERRLVDLRYRAFDQLDEPGLDEWPRAPARMFDTAGIPEVAGRDLTSDVIASGIVHHGSVIVRDMIGRDRVERLRSDIEHAFDARNALNKNKTAADDVAPYFVPFEPGRAKSESFSKGEYIRSVDSPPTLFDLVETYREIGLLDRIEEYLGERPAVSANKSALRCSVAGPNSVPGAGFHQDGAFLGSDIRALNVWLALSDCGGEADCPGLDIVPRRVPQVMPTGTEGAIFPWSVSMTVVDEARRDMPVVRPEFRAGDAILFDELLLHSTGLTRGMSQPRYAIECWFFAPSRYPSDHVPVVF